MSLPFGVRCSLLLLVLSGLLVSSILAGSPPIEKFGGKLLKDMKQKSQPVIGVTFFNSKDLGDEQLFKLIPTLAAVKDLKILDLSYTKVADTELKELDKLNQLTTLILSVTEVSDGGLLDLAATNTLAGRLEELYLTQTKVTDTGMPELARLKKLRILFLGKNKISDAGVGNLGGLSNLKILYLGGTYVTDKGVSQLRQALPQCQIIW